MQDPGAGELLATIRGSAKTESVRVLLLVAAGSEQRATALDLGADDAISRPCDSRELLARVRARLPTATRQRLREKMRIAEEGQQIAHKAFEALAVTEKMTNDAVSLDRELKIGLAAVRPCLVMVGVYFLFARTAQKENQRSNSILAKLEGGIVRQQDLIAEARKLRAQQGTQPDAVVTEPAGTENLKKQADDLKVTISTASSSDSASLQKQLHLTNSRLQRLEAQGQSAQLLFPPTFSPSACFTSPSPSTTRSRGAAFITPD